MWHQKDAKGSELCLIIRGQKPVADWLAPLPVLNLNATANLDLARLTFPNITMPVMPKAERPHAANVSYWGAPDASG